MKILLLGLMYSEWTRHFVEDCLLKNGYEVWMIYRKDRQGAYKNYVKNYKEKGVHFIKLPKAVNNIPVKQENFLKKLYLHFLLLNTVRKSGNYDLINLQYVGYINLIYAAILKFLTRGKLVLSYWGSDLFRMEDKKLAFLGLFAKKADFVTFDSIDLEAKFRSQYKWASRVPAETVYFGLSILDILKEKCEKSPLADVREKWGIPKDKTVVAVGYNGIPEQQHLAVLKEIGKLNKKTKEKLFLILQMTYGDGGTKEYHEQVLAAARATGCEYSGIQNFLTDEQVAELRIITDIFINAQTTDAFSGSVSENLFTGTVLMNASWLRYQEFKDYAFKYLEFKSMSEIGTLIERVLASGFDVSGNKELVWQLRSWENCALKWKKIYQGLTRKRTGK